MLIVAHLRIIRVVGCVALVWVLLLPVVVALPIVLLVVYIELICVKGFIFAYDKGFLPFLILITLYK